jgi:hypothetical protein
MLAACGERLPTGTGDDLFPPGGRAVTVELASAAQAFDLLGRFTGYTGAQDAAFLLVANRFDGALDASTVARFRGFPTFVTVNVAGAARIDSVFAYLGGQVVVPIDTAATEFQGGPVTLELLALAQSPGPDSLFARNGVNTAGARLISSVRITPGEAATRDSVILNVDSLAVRQFAREDFPGLLLRVTENAARLQLGRLSLRTSVRPSQRPDTTVAQAVAGGPQTFVFSAEPPFPASALVAGGVRSARSLFRVTLPQRVPAGPGDPRTVPIDSVTINEAALLLEPLPVGGGWRPLGPVPLQLREVAEPELGARAPLGDIAQDAVAFGQTGPIYSAILYDPGSTDRVVVRVTQHIRSVAARDTTARNREGLATTLALLAQPEAGTFGRAHFRAPPQLRLVYTVPVPSAQR